MGINNVSHVDEAVNLLRQSSMFHACSKETLTKVFKPYALRVAVSAY